jgi:hypothetical protein
MNANNVADNENTDSDDNGDHKDGENSLLTAIYKLVHPVMQTRISRSERGAQAACRTKIRTDSRW